MMNNYSYQDFYLLLEGLLTMQQFLNSLKKLLEIMKDAYRIMVLSVLLPANIPAVLRKTDLL